MRLLALEVGGGNGGSTMCMCDFAGQHSAPVHNGWSLVVSVAGLGIRDQDWSSVISLLNVSLLFPVID